MAQFEPTPTFAGACADGEVAPIPAIQRQSGNLFGTLESELFFSKCEQMGEQVLGKVDVGILIRIDQQDRNHA